LFTIWVVSDSTVRRSLSDRPSSLPAAFASSPDRMVSARARSDAIEAAGGVDRYEELVAADAAAGAEYRHGADRQRELRRPGEAMADAGASLRLGIAGTSRPGAIKCLHAHAAFALAQPDYALGRRILAEAAPIFAAPQCCTP